jgi:hypothetical protein
MSTRRQGVRLTMSEHWLFVVVLGLIMGLAVTVKVVRTVQRFLEEELEELEELRPGHDANQGLTEA